MLKRFWTRLRCRHVWNMETDEAMASFSKRSWRIWFCPRCGAGTATPNGGWNL